jgi:hypothetical protein
MTEGWRCDHDYGLYARVCDHFSVIGVNWNSGTGKESAAASAAEGRQYDSLDVMKKVLDVAVAMAADSNEADSQVSWRWMWH